MSESMLLYGDSRSGNCYKILLLCAELGLDYEWREVDILAGETRRPEFLAKNPNGRIPLLELPDGRLLPESNAILCYLADGTPLSGRDRFHRARILQWLFFEQYSHEPYIATSRFIIRYLGNPPEKRDLLEGKKAGGNDALAVMDGQLRDQAFMCGPHYSIADIALYAYTHVAHEGGFDLGPFPAVRRWLDRVAARAGYRPMAAAG